MFRNHVQARHIRWMLTTAAMLPLFAVAACSSGDDGGPGGLDVLRESTSTTTGSATSPSTTTGSATSTTEGTSGEGSPPEPAACTPEQADQVAEGFDKAACFSHGYREDTLMLVDDKVWTWEGDHLAAYDAATGADVFRSEKPKGVGVTGVHSMAVIEVDGEQMVAVSVQVSDPGDAVTDPTYGWRVLAWPVDAVETGSAASAINAYVEDTDGSALPGRDLTFWGDRGVFVNEHYLRYDATEFETYGFIESYKLPESDFPNPPSPHYVGTSQDLLLGYINSIDHSNDVHFAGFFAVGADGEEVWNQLARTPDERTHAIAVWGDYALDITMDPSGEGGEVMWYDAATGKEATPTPDELAGKNVSSSSFVEINASFKGVKVTPDGKYLTFSAYNDDSGDTYNYILDVAGGTITRIDSDVELTAESMIDTTLYATGDGAAIVDLTTGKATAMKSGTAPFAVSDSFGLFTTTNGYLLAAPTS